MADNSTTVWDDADHGPVASFDDIGLWYERDISGWDIRKYGMYKVEVTAASTLSSGERKVELKVGTDRLVKTVVLDDEAQAWAGYPTTIRGRVGHFGWLLIDDEHAATGTDITSMVETRKWPPSTGLSRLQQLVRTLEGASPPTEEAALERLEALFPKYQGDREALRALLNR